MTTQMTQMFRRSRMADEAHNPRPFREKAETTQATTHLYFNMSSKKQRCHRTKGQHDGETTGWLYNYHRLLLS